MEKHCVSCKTTVSSRWCGALCRACYERNARKENPGVYKARSNRYAAIHRAENTARATEWRMANREHYNALVSTWSKTHRTSVKKTRAKFQYKRNEYQKRREAQKRQSARLLTNEAILQMQSFYEHCPAGYHVDHIVPLNGRNVSGLHVPWNLQYLTAEQNLAKGNKEVSNRT